MRVTSWLLRIELILMIIRLLRMISLRWKSGIKIILWEIKPCWTMSWCLTVRWLLNINKRLLRILRSHVILISMHTIVLRRIILLRLGLILTYYRNLCITLWRMHKLRLTRWLVHLILLLWELLRIPCLKIILLVLLRQLVLKVLCIIEIRLRLI